MIVTLDNFEKGRLKIPNITPSINNTDTADEVQEYIDIYERERLIKGLGTDLYNEVKAAYSNIDNATQAIQDLVKGATYEKDNISLVWEGLNNKYSLLANYIFYKWITENQTDTTSLGEKQMEGKNSLSVSATPKAARAYSDFLDKYQGKGYYHNPRIIHGADGLGLDWMVDDNTEISLYRFLTDNSDSYPNARFTLAEEMNSYGL